MLLCRDRVQYILSCMTLGCLLPTSTNVLANSLPSVSAPSAYGDSVSSGSAAASSTARALAPPAGVKGEGDIGFSLGVSFGASWHANPERRRLEPADGDIAYVVSPFIGYDGEIGKHNFQLKYSTGSESYNDFETENSDWWKFESALQLNLSDILIGDIYASRSEGEEESGASGSRTILASDEDEYREDVLGGRVTFGRRSNPLQIYVGVEEGTLSYLNNNQDFRDRVRTTADAGLFFNISPKTSIFINTAETDYDYLVGNPSIDSTETSVTAGIAWEPSEALSLTVRAGNLKKEFDDPVLVEYDDNTYLGKLSWQPRERTAFSLYASRTTEESAEVDSTFYVSDVIGANLSQHIGARGSVTLRYAVSDNRYSNGREDDIKDYGLSLGYSARNWLSFGLSYTVVDYESTDALQNYENEIISIFVNITPDVRGDGE